MIQYNSDDDIQVSYTTSKAEVHEASGWDEMMRFIINERPIVVHQFWIDTDKEHIKPDVYKMLYSKVKPTADEVVPSDI